MSESRLAWGLCNGFFMSPNKKYRNKITPKIDSNRNSKRFTLRQRYSKYNRTSNSVEARDIISNPRGGLFATFRTFSVFFEAATPTRLRIRLRKRLKSFKNSLKSGKSVRDSRSSEKISEVSLSLIKSEESPLTPWILGYVASFFRSDNLLYFAYRAMHPF